MRADPDFAWVEELNHKHCGNRKRWLEIRKRKCGASDVAIICDESNWNSKYKLCCEKKGLLPEEPENPRLEWCRSREPEIARWYSKTTGRKIFRPRSYTIFFNPDYPDLTCTIDYFQIYEDGTQGILEIKTDEGYVIERWDEEAPRVYLLQLQAQLAATTLSKGTIVCSLRGGLPFYSDSPRHEAAIQVIAKEAKSFMEIVYSDGFPPVDASSHTTKALDAIYRNGEQDPIMLPDAAIDWDNRIVEIDKTLSGLDKERTLLRNRIKATIGDRVVGKLPDATWTFRTVKKDGYYVEPAEYMTLRRSKKGI